MSHASFSAHLQDALHDGGDADVGVRLLAPRLHALRAAPGAAQGLAVVGHPPVFDQLAGCRAALRVLLEALLQKVGHVRGNVDRQLRSLVLRHTQRKLSCPWESKIQVLGVAVSTPVSSLFSEHQWQTIERRRVCCEEPIK